MSTETSTATSATPVTSRAAGTSITERLVGALTATWAAIQDRHADVPDVVLTLGSGTIGARRGEVTWGHFAAGRWHLTTAGEHAVTEPADDVDQDDDERQDDEQDGEEHGGGAGPGAQGLAELFVSGEGLRRGARAVLGTLLHEAAHGVASTRGIKDTSRQGRASSQNGCRPRRSTRGRLLACGPGLEAKPLVGEPRRGYDGACRRPPGRGTGRWVGRMVQRAETRPRMR